MRDNFVSVFRKLHLRLVKSVFFFAWNFKCLDLLLKFGPVCRTRVVQFSNANNSILSDRFTLCNVVLMFSMTKPALTEVNYFQRAKTQLIFF